MKLPKTKNIFCASNPAKLADALRHVLMRDDFSNDIIFLPSRRAVRTVERMLADIPGRAVMLPKLVALGEAVDDEFIDEDTVSNIERTIVLAKMLETAENLTFASSLTVAGDLIRMTDYLENEGRGQENINWAQLVGERYARHFQKKAEFLDKASSLMRNIFPDKITEAQKRNTEIRGWIEYLENHKSEIINHKSKIIICGSTGSVPATADLMKHVAGLENGYIILPGRINELGTSNEELGTTNPYHSEMKFLERIGVVPADVETIEVGESEIGFFNAAFSNNVGARIRALGRNYAPLHSAFTMIDCSRESEEAEVVAEIAKDAAANGKSVLVITPDAAGNQRIYESFARRGMGANFSGGVSGAMTAFGRAVLNGLDKIKFNNQIKNIFEFIDGFGLEFSESDLPLIQSIKEVSDIILRHNITITLHDALAVVALALSSVQLRPPMFDDCRIDVLGTIESRMQTADVVIMTGLNEGMFPATGYENPWIPRRVADELGLPPPNRKVSLMAMDFITLSCARSVYWTRSRMAGGCDTTESRFLSRVAVAGIVADGGEKFKEAGKLRDIIAPHTLDYSAPMPPADWSDVHVTELDLLIHNPYAFYARHILRLKPKPDPWDDTTAIDFGNLTHDAIEQLTANNEQLTTDDVIKYLDHAAKEKLEPGSVLFHFWHNRFVEMAPSILEFIDELKHAEWSVAENDAKGVIEIAGRNVRARADRVYIKDKTGVVVDIKTGQLPTNAQLNNGMMPQLPLEAYMLQTGSFERQPILPTSIVMKFLSLGRDKCGMIEYAGTDAADKISAALAKTKELFDMYSAGSAAYEYRETNGEKYKAYDDLARVRD
ncbi:MAG: PD-(D/E)XK nuclease family protein [Alphaproteobacteria bacterium]|nr:PD-(D/E)XK nuclease family protein [Alphaproteobacteria bacterium]